MDKLIIAGRGFDSRLLIGTGKFASCELVAEALEGQEVPGSAASWFACLVAAAQRLQGSYYHERELYQYKQIIDP